MCVQLLLISDLIQSFFREDWGNEININNVKRLDDGRGKKRNKRPYGLFAACRWVWYQKHIKHLASFIFAMYKFSICIEIYRTLTTHTHIEYLHTTIYRNTTNQMLFEWIFIKSETNNDEICKRNIFNLFRRRQCLMTISISLLHNNASYRNFIEY